MASQPHACAVVGGGASGAMAAIAIGRRDHSVAVTVFEPRLELGRGYAYSTPHPEHLLNVPAGRMSVDPAEPADFVRWCAGDGGAVAADEFVPRQRYGRYLGERSRGRAEHVRARVVDVARRADGRFDVHAADGTRRSFDHVVVATGYGPSPGARTFSRLESPAVVRDPYGPDAFAAVPRVGDIVVVGTGLTAIDVIITLAGCRPAQRVVAVSRRGITPMLHDLAATPTDIRPTATTARGLLRELRAAVADAEATGGDWRCVVDGFRPHIPDVWRSLPVAERARIVRHGRRVWDVHRHRLAPAVADRLGGLLAAGRVSLRRGSPIAVCADGHSLSVTLSSGGHRTTLDAAGLVVCTGAIDDEWMAGDPLLARLVDAGLVAPDPLGLGPAVDADGRFVGRNGAASAGLWAVGPLRRAAEWEATSIPEIRRHAAEVAARIVP